MNTSRHVKLILGITTIVSIMCCNGYNQESVSFKTSKKINNSPFVTTVSPLSFSDSIDTRFVNYPDVDTFRFKKLYQRSLDKLFKKNAPDSLQKNHLNVFSGIRNDTTIIIVDLNKDFDFSNDKIIFIDSVLRDSLPYKKEYREQIPSLRHNFDNGFSYNFKVFPWYGYFYPVKDSLAEEVRLVSEMKEYWRAEFKLNNIDYKIAINGNSFRDMDVLFAPKNEDFIKPQNNKYFPYSHIDTVLLESEYYTYDISDFYNDKTITLTKLENGFISKNGYRIGEEINNISFMDFTSKRPNSPYHELYDILKTKKYLLIDFWGTWCAPCIELTPNLKELKSKYSDELNLFSIALDNDREAVKAYVEKKQLDWYHTLVYAKPKSREARNTGIIKDLHIRSYPTFILVDSNHNILYRGFGRTALENIEEIIK